MTGSERAAAAEIAIRAEGLGKKYRIATVGERRPDTLRDVLARGARRVARRLKSPFRGTVPRGDRETVWALRDLSFEVRRGEVLGVVGPNGAGKTTLLKILSRITEPTTGRVSIRGRVGSLLEVGTGFHAELTGRENIYLNGAILGMTRTEIDRKFDEIVEFAGIRRFLETPVKHYSSGMYLRLGFSVAAHLEPEILLVDEVLAVGDAEFQKKCLGKMGSVARAGRTVIFVSHNLVAVESMCDRVLLLKGGRLIAEGRPRTVIGAYMEHAFAVERQRTWPDPSTAPGSPTVRLRRICVRPVGGTPSDPLRLDAPLVVEVEYESDLPDAELWLSLRLFNEQDVLVFDSCPPPNPDGSRERVPAGRLVGSCRIPGNLLNDGLYRIEVMILQGSDPVIQDVELSFRILDSADQRGGWYGDWPGVLRPELDWNTRHVEADDDVSGSEPRPDPANEPGNATSDENLPEEAGA